MPASRGQSRGQSLGPKGVTPSQVHCNGPKACVLGGGRPAAWALQALSRSRSRRGCGDSVGLQVARLEEGLGGLVWAQPSSRGLPLPRSHPLVSVHIALGHVAGLYSKRTRDLG